MKNFKQFLLEEKKPFSMDELPELFAVHDMAIISAERSDNTKGENAAATRKLESLVKASGYRYEPARGGFIENKGTDKERSVDGERSFLIFDTEDDGGLRKLALKLGSKFDQDSVFWSAAADKVAYFLGTTKRQGISPTFGSKEVIGKPFWGTKGEYYTKIKAGYFTFK